MTLLEILALFAIAGICGAIGQAIAGVTRNGCLASIGLGFIGALLGRIVADKYDLPSLFDVNIGGSPFPIVWSILFSALFVAVVSFLARKSSSSSK
jgi:uncharacterized membrane protein YeaQ/YmgE (transglycosylase-associated protein family)